MQSKGQIEGEGLWDLSTWITELTEKETSDVMEILVKVSLGYEQKN